MARKTKASNSKGKNKEDEVGQLTVASVTRPLPKGTRAYEDEAEHSTAATLTVPPESHFIPNSQLSGFRSFFEEKYNEEGVITAAKKNWNRLPAAEKNIYIKRAREEAMALKVYHAHELKKYHYYVKHLKRSAKKGDPSDGKRFRKHKQRYDDLIKAAKEGVIVVGSIAGAKLALKLVRGCLHIALQDYLRGEDRDAVRKLLMEKNVECHSIWMFRSN